MIKKEYGEGEESLRQDVITLLKQLEGLSRRVNEPAVLERMTKALRVLVSQLDSSTQSTSMPAGEQADMQEMAPPDKTMEELLTGTDRGSWKRIGSHLFAVPYPVGGDIRFFLHYSGSKQFVPV